MANSQYLQDCYRSIRELVHYACVISMTDTSEKAKLWRHEVTYSAILLLRVTMAVLDFRSNPEEEPWDDLLEHLPAADDDTNADGTPVNLLEHACRAPPVLAYTVRKEILRFRTELRPNTLEHPCNEYIRLLDLVGDYLKGFSGLEKLMRTPMPFPLVQMAKMFLYVWLFTLPFVLCHDGDGEYSVIWLMALVALITFGFLGLEFVAIELADNFGSDPCDFDNLGYAELCQEDCYIAIGKLDGHDWARRLRQRVQQRLEESELNNFSRKYQNDWISERGTLGVVRSPGWESPRMSGIKMGEDLLLGKSPDLASLA